MIRVYEVIHAHKRMMLGASLEQAADTIGAEKQDLDLALWRHIGRHGFPDRPARRAEQVRVA